MEGIGGVAVRRLLGERAARPQQGGAVDEQCADGLPVQLCGRLRRRGDVQLRSAPPLPLLPPAAAACPPLRRRPRRLCRACSFFLRCSSPAWRPSPSSGMRAQISGEYQLAIEHIKVAAEKRTG